MSETADTVITGGYVVTIDPDRQVFTDGYVAFRGGRIVGVGKASDCPFVGDETIDARGKAVLPGIANAHNHLLQVAFRGYNDDRWPLAGGVLAAVAKLTGLLFQLSSRLDDERGYAISRLHALEMTRAGYTSTHDEHFTNEHPELADGMWSALRDSGLRGFVARCIINSDLVPPASREDMDVGIAEVERLRARFASDLIQVAPSFLNFAWVRDPSEMVRVKDAALAMGVPLEIDMTDNSHGARLLERGFEGGQVEYYDSLGILEAPLYAGKAVGVRAHEFALMVERDARAALVPALRIFDGRGLPIHHLLAAGALPGLGTDAPLVSDCQSPWRMMRDALLAQKLAINNELAQGGEQPADATLARSELALEMATLGGAKALFQEQETGSLEVEKGADCVVLDLEDVSVWPTYDGRRILSNLVWAGEGQLVDTVFVAGRKLLSQGRSTIWDEEEVIREAEDALRAAGRESGFDESLPSRLPGEVYRGWAYR